ncbi:hypothetical protein [Nitrospira sp. Nam74]
MPPVNPFQPFSEEYRQNLTQRGYSLEQIDQMQEDYDDACLEWEEVYGSPFD